MDREPRTLIEAIRYYSDQDVCLKVAVKHRWPDGVICPTCGSREVSFLTSRRLFQCKHKHPKRQFSVKVGTIFEDSPIGLDKWLPALWMIANDKNGISSYEVHRALGVTQKTAWFMLQRIRLAMQTDTFHKLAGEIEIDETFIGGKARYMHKAKRAERVKGGGTVGKTAVMGLLERHGPDGHSRVRGSIVANTKRRTLAPAVEQQVELGSEVFTDALKSYDKLDGSYVHQVIDHAESYARGKVHTNGLENFWSLLKRAIKGTYVSVEPFHLFRYLDEETFRFNTRKGNDAERFKKVAGQVVGRRLTYRNLTGKTLDLSGINL
jgi:transposase-like protein